MKMERNERETRQGKTLDGLLEILVSERTVRAMLLPPEILIGTHTHTH